MKKINIGNSGYKASEIIMGCMRIDKMSVKELASHVDVAMAEGITLFDHADLYGGGACESLFGEMLAQQPGLREQIQLQSKTGIRDGYYDCSKNHILESVDQSLRRLRTDYLDFLLLHRPDTLMEAEEVAKTFDILESSGKVRHFGLSNFDSMQIELLKAEVRQPLLVNQIQFSIMHTGIINSGIQANTTFDGSVDRDGSLLPYSRLNKMTLQAWSPFQYGYFEGFFLGNPKFPKLNKVLNRLAKEKAVNQSAIAVAWILRHPAKMQTIVGTTKSQRLKDICKASDLTLTREEWYEIYRAAGNRLP